MMHKTLAFTFLVLFSSLSFSQKNESYYDVIPLTDQDTVVWFGADFSLFKLSNEKKVGQEKELLMYVEAWNEQYKLSISNVKMASWLSVKKVINDKSFTDEAYKEYLLKDAWIVDERDTLTQSEIEKHLTNYSSVNKGLGLVYIIENFYKGDASQVYGYFVWFDIETKTIFHICDSQGSPLTSYWGSYGGQFELAKKTKKKKNGMTGYWLQGMIDATVNFGLEYKESIPKE